MANRQALDIPEVGHAVRVRNRLATVRAVEPYEGRDAQGRLHIVEVEYLDDCRFPEAEQLLWEVEATAKVLGTTSLPGVDTHRPDSPTALLAFVNAHRWTRLNRLRATEGIEDEPLLGVWNSAIQVHPYQLEPVLKALAMPRVSLLLADGVGLGKTIQSGLVLEELLLRRRIRRILVLCPAMLQRQWRYELRRKFNLEFEVIDSDSTFQLRRRLGIDTNPWKAFPRIITSMDYLRMPDVLQQFLQASGAGPNAESNGGHTSPHAPWDLLIVDECHHFAPQSGQRASQRTRMLREIRFLFEHRIFASATPHNGKTICFTGLLELLDPIRFQMTVEMDPQDKENLNEVRIRRLKDDINRQSLRPPFAEQLDPVGLPIQLSPQEVSLYAAVREYRKKGHAALSQATAAERWLGAFLYTLLTKRLLSCPLALARTWWRHLEDEAPDDHAGLFDMARISAERAEDQTRSDEEKSVLEEDAARYSGAIPLKIESKPSCGGMSWSVASTAWTSTRWQSSSPVSRCGWKHSIPNCPSPSSITRSRSAIRFSAAGWTAYWTTRWRPGSARAATARKAPGRTARNAAQRRAARQPAIRRRPDQTRDARPRRAPLQPTAAPV